MTESIQPIEKASPVCDRKTPQTKRREMKRKLIIKKGGWVQGNSVWGGEELLKLGKERGIWARRAKVRKK